MGGPIRHQTARSFRTQGGRPDARSVQTHAAAGAAQPAKEEAPFQWGADMKSLSLCVGIAVAVWFSPHPAGITNEVSRSPWRI